MDVFSIISINQLDIIAACQPSESRTHLRSQCISSNCAENKPSKTAATTTTNCEEARIPPSSSSFGCDIPQIAWIYLSLCRGFGRFGCSLRIALPQFDRHQARAASTGYFLHPAGTRTGSAVASERKYEPNHDNKRRMKHKYFHLIFFLDYVFARTSSDEVCAY